MEEHSYDIKELLNIIRKRIIFIAILTIAGGVISAALSFYVLKPFYSAKCNVIVGKENTDKLTQSDVMMYQDLIKTYSEIAKSRTVAEKAADILNNNITAAELMSQVIVTPETGTQIIDISYESDKPELAANKANALGQAFIEQSQILLPSGSAKILDKAKVPTVPSKPNKKMNIAIGFSLGLMLSVVFVFFLEYLNNTITKEEDIEKYLSVPLLGIIPKNQKKSKSVINKETEGYIIEAYKTMRTNLKFSLKNKNINTLMVCSSGPNEGKTSVASNIATTIHETGKKVLLVDCDFRRPCLHRYFNLSNEKGLKDVLFEDVEVKEVVKIVAEDFHVVTCGEVPYNPSEMLASNKMKDFIKEMELKYDYVILDTPPLVGFTDALTLVEKNVGVMLVVSSEETKIELCRKAKQLLVNVNATLIGAVLNKVDKRTFMTYDYYSYSNKKENRKFRGKKSDRVKRPRTLEV